MAANRLRMTGVGGSAPAADVDSGISAPALVRTTRVPIRELGERNLVRTSYRILLAHDGGPSGSRALAHLLEGPYRRHSASVDLVYIHSEEHDLPSGVDRALASAVVQLRHAGFRVTTRIRNGEAAEALLQILEGESYDLVVVGRRRSEERPIGRFDASVSDRLVHRGRVPVMVVH